MTELAKNGNRAWFARGLFPVKIIRLYGYVIMIIANS